MEVSWTKQAEKDYYDQIDFLLDRWSKETAENFIDQIFEKIEYICNYPQMSLLTNYHHIRKAVLNKHISIFYRIEKQTIVLLRIWPNRQAPEDLDFN